MLKLQEQHQLGASTSEWGRKMTQEIQIRPLGLDDVFYLSEIMDLMGIEKELSKIKDEATKKDSKGRVKKGSADVAAEMIVMSLVKNLHKAKQPVRDWVADLNQIEVKEVNSLGLKGIKDTLMAVSKDKDIADFFNSLVKIEQK